MVITKIYRIFTFTNNLLFGFYWSLWNSRFGLRALCSPWSFQTAYQAEMVNG